MDSKVQNKQFYNQNQKDSANLLEIWSKDNRHFKFTFGQFENSLCSETYSFIEKWAFLDVNATISPNNMAQMAFPYFYKIEV